MTHPPRANSLLPRSPDGEPGGLEIAPGSIGSGDRRSFPAVMWRHKVLLVAGVVIGALLGLGLSLVQPAAYTAESRIFYSSQNGFDPLAGGSFNSDPSRYLEQQAALLTSEPVLAQAVRAEPAIGSVEEVRAALTVTASREADIVVVRAAADTAATAEERADAAVVAYRAYQRASVRDRTTSLQALSDAAEQRQILQRAALYGDGVELVEPPVVKEVSTEVRNATVGGLVGFLMALVGAVVADVRRGGRSSGQDAAARRRSARVAGQERADVSAAPAEADQTRTLDDLDELLEAQDEVWRGSRNQGR